MWPGRQGGAGLGLQAIDQVDDIEETPSDAGPGNGNGEVVLACSGAADKDDIALLSEERSDGQFADQPFIDRGAGEVELLQVIGQ